MRKFRNRTLWTLIIFFKLEVSVGTFLFSYCLFWWPENADIRSEAKVDRSLIVGRTSILQVESLLAWGTQSQSRPTALITKEAKLMPELPLSFPAIWLMPQVTFRVQLWNLKVWKLLDLVCVPLISVPSLPPEHISCKTLTSESLEIMWEPNPDGLHGILLGFKVTYQPTDLWPGTALIWVTFQSFRVILHRLR